VLKKNS